MSSFLVGEILEARATATDRSVREYTRQFRVQTTSITDDAAVAGSATGVPRLGDPYVTNTSMDVGARVRSVSPQQSGETPFLWVVTVEYSSAVTDPLRQNADPILRPAQVEWDANKYQKVVEIDLLGRPMKNSAGGWFDPPVEIDDTRLTLTITRAEADFNALVAFAYNDAINLDVFFGGAATCWKCQGIKARSAYENGAAFWWVTYPFEFRVEGWRKQMVDKGTWEILDGKVVGMVDEFGMPLTEPQLLNGGGRLLVDKFGTVYAQTTVVDNGGPVPGTPVLPGDTLMEVTDASVFPTPPYYLLVNNEEFVLVTEENPVNHLTMIRGQLGTSANHTFAAGDTVVQQFQYLERQVYREVLFSLLNLP